MARTLPLGIVRALAPAALLLAAACARPGAARPGAAPAAAAVAPASPADERLALRTLVDSLVGAAEFANAHWGVLIVDPERGDTLYSRNAGKLFIPASNQKLVTGAAALAQLGGAYRWRTSFVSDGPLRDTVLAGNLWVIGTGDPSLSERMRQGDPLRPLRDAADSLRARGVRHVSGLVLPGGNVFPDTGLGYGWSWDDQNDYYSAGVDELFLNEGVVKVTVRAERARTAAGDGARALEARAVTWPVAAYPRVELRVAVSDTVRPGRPRLAWTESAPGVLTVRGTIAPGDSAVEEVAIRDQVGFYMAGLRQAFAERGLRVRTPTLAEAGGAWYEAAVARRPRGDTLFTAFSPPLAQVLVAMEKPSQNQLAEIFYKTLGLERAGVGTADSGRAVVERQLRAWGLDTLGFVVRDGSGLSRHNYVSPAAVVGVLDAMRRHAEFRTFYDALPIAGVDGTIRSRMRGTPAEGNVRAKTGYVDKARSLSGYVTTADGRLLAFSMLCNNWTVPVRSVERVQDAVAARLAAMRLGAR